MKIRNHLLSLTVIMLFSTTSANAAGGWTILAQTKVGKNGDSDVVRVNNQRKFSSVRLCVYGRSVHLNNFVVQFGNGHRQELDVRENFRPRSCSRPLDLKGERRNVESVMLNYRRNPGDGAPIVRIEAR